MEAVGSSQAAVVDFVAVSVYLKDKYVRFEHSARAYKTLPEKWAGYAGDAAPYWVFKS